MDTARQALFRCCLWLAPAATSFLRTAILLAWAAVNPCFAAELALDRYVSAPDPAYAWKEVNAIRGRNHTVHVIEMTSQRWLTEREVDRPLWKHWLNVIVPAKVDHETALLFIGGGDNTDKPGGASPEFQRVAEALQIVVAELRMVPNQPLVFSGDGKPREEDEIIAFAWDRYLRSGDPKWLPRLPMTKAAVRAMDTVTALCREKKIPVGRFVVAGASKRGWTTWTTAAVDSRVAAIAPMVIDILNVEPSMIHHYRAYGFWAPAIRDYEREGIMNWMGTPEFRSLLRQVDPYEFRERFTMPKYIINSAGDQFFLPDSAQFYFGDLPGEKLLRYVPNTGHSLDDRSVLESFVAWLGMVLSDRPRPRFTWQFPDSGGIVVKAQDKPGKVQLWQATNPDARDFRIDVIGKAWRASPVAADSEGAFAVHIAPPPKGWTAYFLELTYPSGGPHPLVATTPVRVTPDSLPHPAPKPDTP